MSEKRLLLVETAFQLFYQKGVHAVGINEILTTSGIAKKTLYNHFASKDELVHAVVEYRDQCFYSWLEATLKRAPLGPSRIDALFDALDDWFNDRAEQLLPFQGCFFINISGEFGPIEHPVHQQCIQHKKRIRNLIQSQLRSLPLTTQQQVDLANALTLLKEGAITSAHVMGEKGAALEAKNMAKILLKTALS